MRFALALLGGCLMALLLFLLMLYMVAPAKARISEEPLSVASFVRSQESSQTATRTRQQAPQPPAPQQPTPPTPLTPMTAAPTPSLPTLDVAVPSLDSSVQVGAAPAPNLSGLSAADAAPAGDPAPQAGQPEGADSEVVPLNDVRPRYPQRALERGIEGHVRLAFLITPDGRVENIRVLESRPSRVFDREARLAAARWRFAPRTENGLAVAREAVKTLYFRLERGH